MKLTYAILVAGSLLFACNNAENSGTNNNEESSSSTSTPESSTPSNDGGEERISTDVVNNSATASDQAPIANLPVMDFEEDIHDFGEVTEGEVVLHKFKFKNSGQGDLLISNARASCGCTVPSYPKEPIKPGGEGFIEVKFNSENRTGTIDKAVTITANTEPANLVIRIAGQVVPANQ